MNTTQFARRIRGTNPLHSLAGLLGFALAFSTATETGYAQTGGRVQASTPNAKPAHAALAVTSANSPGVLFDANGNPSLVGWTYRFDEQAGTYVAVKPAFWVTMNQNTGAGQGRVRLWQYTSAGQTFHSSSLTANVSYSAAVVKAAATYAQRSEISQGVFGASVFLGYEVDYPDAFVDLAHMTSTDFAPDAWAILSNPALTQAQKQQSWLAAGFGPLVAVGYDLQGYLGVKLSLADTQSYQSKRDFFSLVASYYNAGAGLTVTSGLREALSTSSVSMELEFGGLTQAQVANIQLPTASMAQDTPQLEAWEQNIHSIASNAKQPKGLFLAPCFALSGGPNVEVPPWDEYLLTTAALRANEGAGTLSQLSNWNGPQSLRYFLDRQFDAATNSSFSELIGAAREELRAAIVALSVASRAYMQGSNYALPSYASALQNATLQVQTTNSRAVQALETLRVHVDALPAMTLSFAQSGSWHAGEASWWVPVTIQVTNAGLFRANSGSAIELALQEDRLMVFETNQFQSGVKNTFSINQLRNAVLQSSTLIATGPNAGLRNLTFSCEVNVLGSLQALQVRLTDELDRSASRGEGF